MDVSIIFVNYKTKDLTINAINSVKSKTEGLEYEIFVVDNDSQDGSIEGIEERFPDINIIKNSTNAGFGAANNLAIKQAIGKYIFCLNTDTLLINNAIKIMFDFMEKEENRNIGVCGGCLVDADNNPSIVGGMFTTLTEIIWKLGLRYIYKKGYNKYNTSLKSNDLPYIENLDYICGADIFFRKSVLDEVGIFDENFFMYYEEVDLCKRIKNAGYKVKYVSDAKIQHLENKSCSNYLQRVKIGKKSELYFFKKHYGNQAYIANLLYILMYFISGYIFLNKNCQELLKYEIQLKKELFDE